MKTCVNPQCRRQLENDWTFCPACGFDTRPPMNRATVIGCSHRVLPQNTFCVDCGAQAGSASVPLQASSVQVQTTHIPQQHISLSVGSPPTQNLKRLAARYRDASKLYGITLILGLLCLWPIWIVSYLEWRKMAAVREEVLDMGIDVDTWLEQNGLATSNTRTAIALVLVVVLVVVLWAVIYVSVSTNT